jgi:hypothetical protein
MDVSVRCRTLVRHFASRPPVFFASEQCIPIGVGVDVATGSVYDYPSFFTIEMGETVVVSAPVVE